eukprot:TRINITY_DN2070_c0_g1_i5.p3 TRINITY_DN2070_c0_g1~~TRINITY_DN2070_c0_g1_i5.p3  ORF type:complete len:106 (+),score=29.05 TRINITY_DN2070_c0_g1_i5:8-325(+)
MCACQSCCLFDRNNDLQLQSSMESNPDAMQIAEEMSKKVVSLQLEKEELQDALNHMSEENEQLKQVKQQLEQQITFLVQQPASGVGVLGVTGGKRRLGFRMGFKN